MNESGTFVHTIKNMPEGGSSIIPQNCHFDVNTGWGLAMVNIEKLLVSGCTFTSCAMDVRGINAPTRTWPWDIKNSSPGQLPPQQNLLQCRQAGREWRSPRGIERNPVCASNGDQQSKGETGGLSLDYITDIMVLGNTFEVTGKPVALRNQGRDHPEPGRHVAPADHGQSICRYSHQPHRCEE